MLKNLREPILGKLFIEQYHGGTEEIAIIIKKSYRDTVSNLYCFR